jgi:hypothetical protein
VLVSVFAVAVVRWRGGRLAEIGRRNAAGWVLWGGWLLTVGLMFSFTQGVSPVATVLSIAQLTQWKQQGKLGFVLVGGGPDGSGGPPGQAATGRGGQPGGGTSTARSAWVQKSCTLVSPAAYGGTQQQLYDCR